MKLKSEREVAQSCLTLSDPMDCSLPGFSVRGIFQARVLEWGHCLLHYWSTVDLKCFKFLLYSKVIIYTYMYVYALKKFFSSIDQYRVLRRVPCAI